jgi:hypothetical protein
MAMYECFDSFMAFERYLKEGGTDLEPSVRMLLQEYCKYALDRAWFYYPDALPPQAIAEKQREGNGHIDRKLCFPVEDLYADGQKAGQVGQEIYGAGAAFIFATRAFHRVSNAPFQIYCDHFIDEIDVDGDGALTIRLNGSEGREAGLSVIRLSRRRLPEIELAAAKRKVPPLRASASAIHYSVPASGRIDITWK